MKSMKEVISDSALRPKVVEDSARLIDDEVKRKRGIVGIALKGGYAVVKRLKQGRMISGLINGLLDEFVDAVEPFHAEFRTSPNGDFSDHLKANEDLFAEALLKITDRRADRRDKGILKKTYFKLRPKGLVHVKEAIPGIAALVTRHTT